jgi:hypothetical protein
VARRSIVRLLALSLLAVSAAAALDAAAQERDPRIDVRTRLPGSGDAPPSFHVDRVAVRYVTPETGGNARPRFITERELAFFARLEALAEQTPIEGDEYPERYMRAATDRLVARAMLASLFVQRGTEPPDLPRLTAEAKGEIAERIGGAAVLDATMKSEGLEDAELEAFLRDEVRATWYVDRVITPILAVTEDALREAFRSVLHPFRGMKFEDARPLLRRWLVVERMRTTELEFLQGARARIQIASVPRRVAQR